MPHPRPPRTRRSIELEVVYDGADLADTAALLGMSPDELVRRHTSAEWSVAFTGFAPGFGYLISPDWTFDVPRLAIPRTRVPRGSVGLAAGFTGAYPRDTPGGWRLIGTTDAPLFDPDAASPALLAPGARVRFRAATTAPVDRPPAATPRADGSQPGLPDPDAGVRIVEPGLLATLQDLGRPGAASLGVAASGALDRGSARTANRLVGNPEAAAVIEATMGGFRAIAFRDLWFAVTGAWGPIRLAGQEVDPYEAHPWPAGAELHLEWYAHGARAYLAVRGGFDAARRCWGRARPMCSPRIGPARLRAGDAAGRRHRTGRADPDRRGRAVGSAARRGARGASWPRARAADWFAASAHQALFEAVWTVTNDTDRVGMRLDGPQLARVRDDELPSEGMVPGALQVPPSGRPTILLADGPVTGGYPVIAVATDAALDLLAQARPGTRVRFRHARMPE